MHLLSLFRTDMLRYHNVSKVKPGFGRGTSFWWELPPPERRCWLPLCVASWVLVVLHLVLICFQLPSPPLLHLLLSPSVLARNAKSIRMHKKIHPARVWCTYARHVAPPSRVLRLRCPRRDSRGDRPRRCLKRQRSRALLYST